MREMWGNDPFQWAHPGRSRAVCTLRGTPASHPAPDRVLAPHHAGVFCGGDPGGPDRRGRGNRCPFPLFLLLFLGMFLVFVIGCLICRWKGNLRSYLLSLLIGLLVAAGSLWALYPKGSGTKAWMIPALVVMALLFFVVLSRIRMLDQTDDPAVQEGKPGSTKSSSEQ